MDASTLKEVKTQAETLWDIVETQISLTNHLQDWRGENDTIYEEFEKAMNTLMEPSNEPIQAYLLGKDINSPALWEEFCTCHLLFENGLKIGQFTTDKNKSNCTMLVRRKRSNNNTNQQWRHCGIKMRRANSILFLI